MPNLQEDFCKGVWLLLLLATSLHVLVHVRDLMPLKSTLFYQRNIYILTDIFI